MERLFIIIISLLIFSNLSAQDNAITKYFSAYQSDQDFTKVTITNEMFDLFAEFDPEDEEEKALMEAISKLKGIKVLMNDEASDGIKLFNDAIKKVAAGAYEELMSVEDKEENVKFMIRKEAGNGKIVELLMLNGSRNRFVVMTLFGDIDLKQIYKIGRVMNVRGMDLFEKMEEKEDK